MVMPSVKDMVDAYGFDIVLDDMGAFAMECANIPNQSPDCKEVFETVAAELAKCNRVVSRILLEGIEYLERAQVITNMTGYSLNEVLESELEPGSEIPAGMIAKIPDHPAVAPIHTYDLISDYETYQVATKEELEARGIDPYNENISQQTDKYWVLTIH